jgi:hypothetical protein
MLTKLRSSLTQKPERNSRATIARVDLRRSAFAASSVYGEGPDRDHQTRPRHMDRELHERQARGAHHRDLGILRHAREREEGADEARGGQQHVGVRRKGQHHVREHRGEAIAAAAEVVELADHVEEREEREERREHQQARGQDLAGEVAEEHQRSMRRSWATRTSASPGPSAFSIAL